MASARDRAMLEGLLQSEGLQIDPHIDYALGFFDEDYVLAATGSIFSNTLRCLAVREKYQGEGLMAMVVQHLKERLYLAGQTHLFLYTKPDAAEKLSGLGFYEVARVAPGLVFMETRRAGFSDYLNALTPVPGEKISAVVMNANPFTNGHLYLAEQAARASDVLHLFVVSEDRSFFPYSTRRRLVEEGTRHLKNVVLHDTGSYLISSAVFPAYFLKAPDKVTAAQAALDAALFVKISKRLGVTRRYVGEEPFSPATAIYNEQMSRMLPLSGIECTVLPRKEENGAAVSATRVRTLLMAGETEKTRALVPDATYRFFLSPEGRALIAQRKAEAR